MLLDDEEQTMELCHESIKRSKGTSIDSRCPGLYLESLGVSEHEKLLALSLAEKSVIDPVVNVIVGATSGYLYKSMVGHLKSYPIPEMRLKRDPGKKLLDIGCNWGRWSIAASRLGYDVVGIDPSLGAIMAAQRVSDHLKAGVRYVVGDARFLPFKQTTYDVVFSYSVLQHLSMPNTELCLKEISRVLKRGGLGFIQLANKFGIRSFYHQLKRKFREAVGFEVRYWKPSQMQSAFERWVGETSLEVDGYFGLGIQKSDWQLMPLEGKLVIMASEFLRKISRVLPPIIFVADSLYVKSVKR